MTKVKMDTRMKLLRTGTLPDIIEETKDAIDPVAQSMQPKTMKISPELLERAKIRNGGVSIDSGKIRCFIGLSDER